LIKPNLFNPSELQPIMHDIEKQVESLAKTLLSAGLITDLSPSLGFYQRMAALEKQFPGASVLLHKTPALPPSFQSLWADPRLVDIAQQLIGGPGVDVAGHPVWNLRVKVPQTDSSVVPWHQDAAYLDPESAHTLQVRLLSFHPSISPVFVCVVSRFGDDAPLLPPSLPPSLRR